MRRGVCDQGRRFPRWNKYEDLVLFGRRTDDHLYIITSRGSGNGYPERQIRGSPDGTITGLVLTGYRVNSDHLQCLEDPLGGAGCSHQGEVRRSRMVHVDLIKNST